MQILPDGSPSLYAPITFERSDQSDQRILTGEGKKRKKVTKWGEKKKERKKERRDKLALIRGID